MIFPEQSSIVLVPPKRFPKSTAENSTPFILIHLPTSAVVRLAIVFSVAVTVVTASLESKKNLYSDYYSK